MPVKKEYGVVDCSFAFSCPQSWTKLEKTPFANMRHCGVCDKTVFKCDTQTQADWAIANQQCAAVVTSFMVITMGDIGPPNNQQP